MELALLCLRSEPIGFRKLDNLLCYWSEQELRRQDWHPPGLLSMVAARVYFLVIVVEWSLFVISFSASDPLLFFRIVVCILREACEFWSWATKGLMFLSIKKKKKKKPGLGLSLVWICNASSSLSVWFCFLYLWEGRQTASSPVNAATIGLAASLINVLWVSYEGIISVLSS